MTSHFCGLRQEEHRMFLASVMPDARALRRAVDRGLLPHDAYLAIPCIGAIPYYSDLRTLDWLGLTDTTIAHQPPLRQSMVAHDRLGTPDYGARRGVDVWAVGAHPVLADTSAGLIEAIRATTIGNAARPLAAADLGEGEYLVGYLLQGDSAAARRMPALRFHRLDDRVFSTELLQRGLATAHAVLARQPQDRTLELQLAHRLLMLGQVREADSLYADLTRLSPEDAGLWEEFGVCRSQLGDPATSDRAVAIALRLALASDDTTRVGRLLRNRFRVRLDPGRPLGEQVAQALEHLGGAAQ